MNCAYIVMNGYAGHSRLFGEFLSQEIAVQAKRVKDE